ncbi:MAG: MoaD family protein [Candidatus Bathyarchaeota archaeon]|nr:MoaD family protein [Candidatus Bathyarchaeota archaeon]
MGRLNTAMAVTLKFVGTLRHASGKSELALGICGALSLRELISKLVMEIPALKQSMDLQRLEELQSNLLILVNGREISVLNGFETMLKDGDEIVFVPVVHGG